LSEEKYNMQTRHKPFLLLVFLLCHCFSFAQPFDPIANPASVVRSGGARFTILTDHIVRMEYARDSLFTDQASLTFVCRNLPKPTFYISEPKGDWLTIEAKFFTLHYKSNSGPFTSQNLYIEYHDSGHSFTWRPGMKDDKNLKGTIRTLDGALGKFSFTGMKKLNIEDGILSRSGWTLIDDSERPLFDHSDWPWVQARSGGEVQDLYFFGYGSNYKTALHDFTMIAGKISMPPKFAFGIWYSRYWAYTEAQFKEIAADYDRNNIPLDVLVIDMDWHLTDKSSPEIFSRYTPKPDGWTGFTWEKKYFPDYKEFLAWSDAQKLQTCMNLHPASGVQQHEAAYAAFAQAMGIDTMNHPAIPFDITNKKFAQNYFDILLHPYEKAGVDFWWLDWQQWGGTNIKGVNPTFYLNYVHFSDMQRQGKRPLIFHRWGGLGNHRYEIGFSGDCIINWKSLDYQPEFTATASNVGFGYWSHDIGGHTNPISKRDKQNPELFTRWVEWGAFSPIFRTHATNDPTIERRIWKYPEPNFNAMRKAIQQRYALFPYIYTMARYAYDSGVSIMRPMYYEYPDMDKAYHLEHQYYFGTNMIVSPITKPMHGHDSVSQTVWLPNGNWYDYRNNKQVVWDQSSYSIHTRGTDLTLRYALDEIPVFIRGGSIIPTQTPKLKITGSVLDTVILTVYPGYSVSCFGPSPSHADFTMYEDDGGDEEYRRDICSFTRYTYQEDSGRFTFSINPDGKTFPGQVTERSYEIRIVASDKPKRVVLDGHTLDWSYNDQAKVTIIKTPREKVKAMTIEIE
jgi:alpha-glucosidase (family GH31 glycosyl hydrolase)